MDPLTHALSGALLVRATAPLPRSQAELPLRFRVAAGFVAAAFPDLDFALRLIDTLTYLNWHQGPTHSLLLMPVWAWLLAYLFFCFSRGKYHWKLFYFPACLGIAIHIIGDLVTAYGLMLFAPISTQRFYLPFAFVIDPWFSAIIIAGLAASWIFPRKRVAAIFSLVGLVGYVMFLWMLHDRAMNIGQEYANTQLLTRAEVYVLPQPLSPFHWKIIIKNDESYQVALVSLWRNQYKTLQDANTGLLKKMVAAYQPFNSINWQHLAQFGNESVESELVREAWNHPVFANFRRFSVFPQLDRVDNYEKKVCVWFFDLRFQFPGLPPSFRYGMCRDSNNLSDWHIQRQRGTFWLD
jgi:inner membrane protein